MILLQARSRLFAGVLSVVLILALLPCPVYAATQEAETEPLPPPPPAGPTIETDLFGEEASFPISEGGEILEPIEATSEDENLTMTIPEGTILLDEEGNPLETLEAAVDETPPEPPENAHVIGLAYNFGPAGAIFSPPIAFTWNYDPDALPEGVAGLVLAYYDEETGEWVELPCTVDPVTHTITASVAHFTTFAIIGTVPPVPPPPPVEEEEVVPPEEEEEVPPVEEEEAVPPVEEEEVVPPVEEEEEVPPVEDEEEVAPPEPINWLLIGGVILIGVLLFLLLWLIRRRRASY